MQFQRFVFFILGVMEFFFVGLVLFGLLASQEPGVHMGWTIGYALGLLVLIPTGCYFIYMAFKRADT